MNTNEGIAQRKSQVARRVTPQESSGEELEWKARASIIFLLVVSCSSAGLGNLSSPATPTSPLTIATPTFTDTPTTAPTTTETIPAWQATNTVAVARALATSAAQVATALAAPTGTRAPTPTPGMLFKYDNGVAPDQRRLIEDSIHLAKKYLGDVWTLNVYAAENSKLFCDEYALQGFNEDCKALDGFLAVSTGYHIFIKTYAEGWQRSPAPIRIHEIVHEYFHVVQHFLINRRSPVYAPRSSGAFWLTEGSAEFAGAQVLYYEGLFDVALIRRSKILEARQIRAPLKSLETRGGAKAAGSGSEYSLGFLGTEYLALNYGGRQSLLDYYETIGTSLPWQDAFKKTFGMSVDEFYDNFAEYRRVNFPPNP